MSSNINDIFSALKQRILVLDGAMGTMLQQGYDVATVHRMYIDAGADIIETSTFNLKGYDDTLEFATIARQVADEYNKRQDSRTIYVAGILGPFEKILSLADNALKPEARACSFDQLVAIYRDNARALLDANVDLVLVETVFDSLNAKAALYALDVLFEERGVRLPIMVSATINDKKGRLLTGMEMEAFYNAVSHAGLMSFGVNCSYGAEDMAPVVREIAGYAQCAVSMHPNAGLPNQMGGYDQTPQQMADLIASLAKEGCLNIAGGCCGTSPEHIRAISEALKGIAPRPLRAQGQDQALTVSGLQTVKIDLATTNFINVGERTNVAGSRKFARLISEKNYEEAARVARRQIEDGASIIDINLDDPMLDSAVEMETFVRYITNDPAIAKAAFMIDSSDWNTVLAGIKNAPGRSIVNSLSLKEGEETFLNKAREIRRLGAALIVMAFDEQGQATSYERKVEICTRAFNLLTEKAGYQPSDIIFDVNVLTIGTGMGTDADYAVDFIAAVRTLKATLPGCHCSGGVSNLSFAFRGNNPVREAMHAVFLYHAIAAGLDMAIVNPGMLQIYSEIDPELRKCAEDVILNSDDEATSRLTDLASRIKEASATGSAVASKSSNNSAKSQQWLTLPVEERLCNALVRGIEDYLPEDLAEALKSRSAISIIEDVLLQAMDNVGEMFSSGKMFLPQVIKASKTMRSAVDILQPHIEAGSTVAKTRKKIILATAKGDVHDIGKNILGIVLSCNGLDVIDLGVMVDNADILAAQRANNADYIGISGLITPSLKEMANLCTLLEEKGCNVPLFIGGATTSALHTVLKLAPLRKGCVIYTNSASDCANMLTRFGKDATSAEAQVRKSQRKLLELHGKSNETFVSVEEARMKCVKPSLDSYIQPEGFGRETIFRHLAVKDVANYIDWSMFLAFWGFKCGNTETALKGNPEASKCYKDGAEMLMRMESDTEISVNARFFDAVGCDEDIVLDGGVRLGVGRATSSHSDYSSLADFVAPASSGMNSTIGLFAVKVEDRHHCCDCRDYEHMLRESLCSRLAEAAAEWLDNHIHESIADQADGTRLIRPAFGYSSCPDHSLKRKAFDLLDVERLQGISLTSSFAMVPTSSICGMLICHPQAKYLKVDENK